MKKIPYRTCVITHEKLPKNELVRVVKTPEDNVVVDLSGKQNGRGAYLKLSLDTIEKAKKTKALDRHLEIEVKDEVYEQLISLIK